MEVNNFLETSFFYTYLFIQLPKPSEYPNVLKISAGDYWCIQNNGWSIDSATEIYGNNKLYHQLKKELRIRKT
ncbi:hypothetical protein [Peribacillus sp. TH14]|uniref:hypothetical protein n=1 Tax=Peribacillus sp. TH14 TaxID=2798481 RepID=UPI0019131672|nr:hypothetical protein [Peribacillus sp. TH14]MBK5502554.1 hypothetical protein [Peribacillus sp. TH14]